MVCNMFSNTGNISLWLSVSFVMISLCGIFVIYLIIKNKTIENENIDKIIDLGKWLIVSVAMTLSTSIINDGFREREQDIKEMEVFDKYVETILEADGIEKRKLLCEYFASVSPDGYIKKSWENYQKIIDNHIAEIRVDEKRILEISKNAEAGKASVSDIEEKVRLEVKASVLSQSLVSDQDEWVVIAGGDSTPEAANDEVKNVKTLNYAVGIYKKGNRYRTVIGPFVDKNKALTALPDIRKNIREGSYLVNLKTWCKSPETKENYIECR